MKRCKCGSYAINIEMGIGDRCDVCHYKEDALRYRWLKGNNSLLLVTPSIESSKDFDTMIDNAINHSNVK